MTEPTPTPVERPKPLTTLAFWLGPALGLIGGLVGFLVPLGLITQANADLINQFSHAVVGDAGLIFGTSSLSTWAAAASGLITAGSTAAAVLVHARLGRQHVTPISDPRDNDGIRLVRADLARIVPISRVATPAATTPAPVVPEPRGEHEKPEETP